MDVVHPRCCGLDVHKQMVVACVLSSSPSGPSRKTIRTFRTLTDELLALGDWLTSEGVTHVALEATGSYWKPVARQMLEAIVGGATETEAAALAQLARGRMREKIPQLQRALAGRVAPHQRFMLARQLAHIDFLDETIEQVSHEVAERLHPFEELLINLDTIPGVGRHTAETLLAEIGTDMTRFPSAAHLASWAGMCPGQDESAGKRRSGKTRKGSPALRHALIQAAHAAARSKDTYLAAQFHRLAARRGSKKAAVAVGHSILIIVWHLLDHGDPYHDLGGNYFDTRNEPALARHLVRRLKSLGYDVNLQRSAA